MEDRPLLHASYAQLQFKLIQPAGLGCNALKTPNEETLSI